tara:strand:- start:1410 stop:1592 length:183 start_codon:yes stop_codon:yes gene_type:complete
MSFEKGRLVKNLMYGITHPLKMAKDKPIMFMMVIGTGVFFLGVAQGWWSIDSIKGLNPFK